MSRCLSLCHVTFSKPLIGQKRECYIAEEVIKADELDKGNISTALGKQDNKERKKKSPPKCTYCTIFNIVLGQWTPCKRAFKFWEHTPKSKK